MSMRSDPDMSNTVCVKTQLLLSVTAHCIFDHRGSVIMAQRIVMSVQILLRTRLMMLDFFLLCFKEVCTTLLKIGTTPSLAKAELSRKWSEDIRLARDSPSVVVTCCLFHSCRRSVCVATRRTGRFLAILRISGAQKSRTLSNDSLSTTL